MPAELLPRGIRFFKRNGNVVTLEQPEYKHVESNLAAIYHDVNSGYSNEGYSGGFKSDNNKGVSIMFCSHNRALNAADFFISKGLTEDEGIHPTRRGVERTRRKLAKSRGIPYKP